MTAPFHPSRMASCPSGYRLDQWQLGQLHGEDLLQLEAHVSGCPRCGGYVAELERAADTLLQHKPAFLRAAGALPHRPAWHPRGWGLALVASVALVAIAPRLLSSSQQQASEPWLVAHDTVRSKGGGGLGFTVYRERQGTVIQLATEASVNTGDRLRFVARMPTPGFLMVVGVEADGDTFPYYPLAGAKRATYHAEPGEIRLPEAVELDDSVGRELIRLLTCPTSFDFSDLQAERLPEGCRSAELTIHKERT